MAKHVWTVLCRDALLDRFTNSVSLINTIERIELSDIAPEHPGETPIPLELKIDIVSFWVRSDPATPEIGSARISLITPDGSRTNPALLPPLDLENTPRVRVFGERQNLPYVGPGIYETVVEMATEDQKDWQEVARIPMEVVLAENQG
jgi:hypothetical protein